MKIILFLYPYDTGTDSNTDYGFLGVDINSNEPISSSQGMTTFSN